MSESGKSRADKNRAIRRENLREQLAAQGHVQHVIDITMKLSDLDTPMDSVVVQRLKAASDNHWKAIDKYLPSIKAIELTGEDGEPVKVTEVKLVPLEKG